MIEPKKLQSSDVQSLSHVAFAPKRTASKYVSEAFNFLNNEEYDENDESNKGRTTGLKSYNRESQASSTISNDYDNHWQNGHSVSEINGEFTIVTSVESDRPPKGCPVPTSANYAHVMVTENANPESDPFTIVTYVNNDEKESVPVRQINPVYEVDTYLASSDIESGTTNTDSSHTRNDKENERRSVVIDGQEVELRQPLTDKSYDRKSRQSSWQKNHHAISEAFDFLQEFRDSSVSDDQRISGSGCENDEESKIKEQLTDAEVKDVDTSNDVNKPDCCADVLSEESEVLEEASLSGKNAQVESLRQADSEASISGGSETEEVGELKGRVPRRRNKGAGESTDNGDDDGGSSDEDTGVYRESFRKSTWLYIGDNSDVKRGVNPAEYVPLADLGLASCDDDSIFGDGPQDSPSVAETTAPLTPTGGHARNASVSTTASEKEFQSKQHGQFNSVSKRFVQRADSQQEYRRYTAKFYDQVKFFVVERDSTTGYGIHVLDSKPAVVSGVDPGSPAEKAGLREGFVLISLNGENVLEAEHADIIDLVQDNSTTLSLEVGFGDLSPVVDLQVPVQTGYLSKQTSATLFRTWKKRYFILRRDSCLYYYKTEQDTDPLGAIPLCGYAVSRHGDFNKFGFKMEKYGSKTFYFQADNRDEMTEWVGCLTEAANRGKYKKDSWMDVTTNNVGLPALQIRKPDCSGYLFKLGRATRRWRKRYCVLKDACIYYYKSKNSKSAEGVVHLHGYSIDQSEVFGKKHSFSLHPPESQMRIFSFYADNDTDRSRWLEAMETSIGKWVKVE